MCPPCISTARRIHLALHSLTPVAPSPGSVHLPGVMFPEASVRVMREARGAWQPHQDITVIRSHFPPGKGLCPSSPGTGALLNPQFPDFRSKLWGNGQRSLGRPRLESALPSVSCDSQDKFLNISEPQSLPSTVDVLIPTRSKPEGVRQSALGQPGRH